MSKYNWKFLSLIILNTSSQFDRPIVMVSYERMQSEIQSTTYRANDRQDNTGGVCRDDHIGCREVRRGACPNPGPATIGYIVEGDGWTEEGYDHIGESINNEPSTVPSSEGWRQHRRRDALRSRREVTRSWS